MRTKLITIFSFLVMSSSAYGQEPKMDCYMYSSETVPCVLKAYKKVNDTLFAIAPLNCNAYSFDTIADGTWKIFASDSTTLIEIANVENGMREGVCRDYYSNGKLRSDLIYWQNEIDQHVRTYYWDNGKIARYEEHTSSSKGASEYYDKEGHPIDAETFLSLWCRCR